MRLRVCGEEGCPVLVPASARGRRCPTHRRAHERERGTRQQRGYDTDYDAIGRDYQRRMDEGQRFNCWRPECNKPLGTKRGTDWTLGHDDADRTVIHGPECPACQYATSGRRT